MTPIGAAARGAAAGLAATLVLSALSRVMPGLWEERGDQQPRENPTIPENPEDSEQLGRWQAQMQSPAAFQPQPAGKGAERHPGPPGVTPAGALTQPQGTGPEGLA